MKKLLLLIAVALLTSIATMAQPRSEQQAIQIAQDFFAKSTKKKAPKLSVVSQQKVTQQIRKKVASAKKAPAQHSSCYIINDEANNRFVIVSADERMYQILGYSDNGCFEAENAPDGLIFMLGEYERQTSALIQSQLQIKSKRAEKKTPIPPLLQSSWGQNAPYNLDCPEVKDEDGNDVKSAAGCVATAMAQAMNYFKYPQKGSGSSVSYWLKTINSTVHFDFNTLTINWDNILNVYDENSTEAQRKEIAKLIHACGVSVFMEYDTSSGANPGDIPYAMINHFGYNRNMQYIVKDYYDSKDWRALIETELKAERPIIYGGRGSTIFLGTVIGESGHQFILDGMDEDGLYHFNFGWEGKCDSYLSIDAINPSELNGFLTYDFNSSQGMVIGVTPETIGEPEDIFYTIFLELDTVVSVNSRTQIKYQPYCCSNLTNEQHSFVGELGVGVFDNDWTFVKALTSLEGSDLPAGSWRGLVSKSSFRYDPTTFSDGSQYYIALYAKHQNSSKATLVRTKYGEKDWYVALVKDDTVYLHRKGIIPSPGPIPYPSIREGLWDVTALNESGERAKWQVTITREKEDTTLYSISNLDTALVSRKIEIKNVKGKMGTNGTITLPNGQSVGEGYVLNNFTGKDIEIVTYPTQSKMEILGYWGVIEASTGKVISQYHETQFSESKEDDIVLNPTIKVNEQHILTINCATEDATIHFTYTDNGTEPTKDSQKYTGPVALKRNGIVKAVAVKNSKQSEVVSEVVESFVVSPPQIFPMVEGGIIIKMACETLGASIYYSIGRSAPNTLYNGEFECKETTTIQAIAKLDGWRDSEITEYYHIVPPSPDVVIANEKGNLPNIIAEKDRMEITSLTITGELNGTDIQLIRNMLKNGKLAYLDIENTKICSGGEPYDNDSNSEILWKYTEDNIIGSGMFSNSKNLVSIKLPSSATEVGMSSLADNSSLKEIYIPKDCQEIKSNAITNCDRLEAVHIPAKVKIIDGSNFSDCDKLINISVDASNRYFESVSGVLFDKDLETLIKYPFGISSDNYRVPDGVRTIGERAFAGVSLKTIQLPEGLREIGTSAFNGCKRLNNLVLPASVRTINMFAFSGCTSLSSVTLSEKLLELRTKVFGDCPNLREIHIGKDLYSVAGDAFADCSSLISFSVDEENPFFTEDGGILYTKDMSVLKIFPLALYMKEFRIPYGVKTIGEYSFRYNKNIKKIVLPKTVTKIEKSAFMESAIQSIEFYSNLSEIGMFAFANCKNLESVILPEGIEELATNVFSGCERLEILRIPSTVKKIESNALTDCKWLNTIICAIEDTNLLEVYYSSYAQKYTPFDGMNPTCKWIIHEGIDANIFKTQPWWISTWIIEEGPDAVSSIYIDSKEESSSWYNLNGTRLDHKPTQRGIYLHGGKKVTVK